MAASKLNFPKTTPRKRIERPVCRLNRADVFFLPLLPLKVEATFRDKATPLRKAPACCAVTPSEHCCLLHPTTPAPGGRFRQLRKTVRSPHKRRREYEG